MNETSLKLKRHETFSIREGWIEKALNYVHDDNTCFKKENGTKILGIGTNMVKSLHYWVSAANLVEFNSARGATLTEVGELIYNYDKYLTSKFSWWIIHFNLASNFDDAPVISQIFNSKMNKFEKEFLSRNIQKDLEKDYVITNVLSLEADVQIFLKSYYSDDFSNPENNYNCPLAKLGLLDMVDKNVYEMVSPEINDLDYRVIYFSLLKCLEIVKESDINKKGKFNLEDLYEMKNNPMNIFNLTKSAIFYYLDILKQKGFISLHKTAGLNTIYIEKYVSIADLFQDYFKED